MSTCPDYQHWLSKSEWFLDDAALLVLGVDPNSYPRPRVDPGYVGQPLRMKSTPPPPFWKLLHAAMDAEGRELSVLEYSSERVWGMECAKVQPAAFVYWAEQAGYGIPNELANLLGEQEPQPPVSKQDQQVECIVRVVRDLGYKLLAIPVGGKKEVKKICLQDSRLFTASTFLKAWQVALNRQLIRTTDHEKYSNTKFKLSHL